MSPETKRRLALSAFQFWEILIFIVAFVSAAFAAEAAGYLSFTQYAHAWIILPVLFLAFAWHGLLKALGFYDSRRLVARTNEYLAVLGAVTGAAALMAFVGSLLFLPINNSPFLIWFIGVGFSLMIVGRVFARMFLRAARSMGRNLRYVTVIGAGAQAQQLAQGVLSDQANGYRVNAFFDTPDALAASPEGLGPCRDLAELTSHLMRDPVDEVLIAMPKSTNLKQVTSIVAQCHTMGVTARAMWPADEIPGAGPAALEVVGKDWVSLHFDNKPDWGWQAGAKRMFDIFAASLALVTLSPVLLTIALLIRLDGRGPVFFLQERAGRNKIPFRLIKFRTMVQNAEALQAALEGQNEAAGPVFKIKRDPRVTRIGQFLRRSSLDELPQLINVVRGEMSLVGPRPLPIRDVTRFEHQWYSRRFSVKPGLTCSWVLAGRSELDFDSWVRLDLDYIDNWSFWRDVKICFATIPAVLKSDGAY